MAIKPKEQAVIDLVINGQQAQSSLRELSGAYNALLSSVSRLNQANDPEHYHQQVELLAQVRAARDAERQSVLGQTEAQKGFFSDFKKGFGEIEEMAGRLTIGTLIYKGIGSVLEGIKEVWSGSEKAAEEAIVTQTALGNKLTQTGSIAGVTKEHLETLQKTLMNQTGVDDDVIAKSEDVALSYENVRGKIYDQLIPATVNLAAAQNKGKVTMDSISEASTTLSAALDKPTEAKKKLKAAGILLTDQMQNEISQLVQHNKLQQAQQLILDEVTKRYGNLAQTLANTEAGELQRYETRIGNIQESIGAWIIKGKALKAEILDPFLSWVEKVTSTDVPAQLREEQAELNSLVDAIIITNNNQAVRNQLIAELQAKYPDFIGNIKAEGVSNDILIQKLEKVNSLYRDKIFMAVNEDKIKDLQDQRTKAIRDEADARERVAKATGLSHTELAKLTDQQIKDLAVQQKRNAAKADEINKAMAGAGTAPGHIMESQEAMTAEKDADLIINGRQRIAQSDKELGDLMSANAVIQDKVTKKQVADIDLEIAALRKKMETEKESARVSDQVEVARLEQQKKTLLGIVDTPQSGPTIAQQNAAAKKLEEYNKELKDVRQQTDQLAETARKGTIDDLDAQLKVIQDKYEKVIGKIKELLKDPHTTAAIRTELTNSMNILGKDEQLDKDNTSAAFKKAQEEKAKKEQEDQLKATEASVNNVYDQGKAELGNQENKDLNGVSDADPKIAADQRLNIQEQYAQKRYLMEQQNLEDLKTLYQAYGKDTGKLDKQIADNTIKENERAAKVKEQQDVALKLASKTLQKQELDNLSQGAELLESVLNKKSALYKAAFIVDKAVAIARVIIETNVAIAAFRASVALLGPLGVPLLAAYTIGARISEGLSIAAIAVAAAEGLSGGSATKAAKGGVFEGPSHANGGLNVVDTSTGQTVANVEGGEPWMVLSKDTQRNNAALINELLFNSMYKNGAAVDVAGINSGIRIAKNGGMFNPVGGGSPAGTGSAVGTQVLHQAIDLSETNRLLVQLTEKVQDQQVVINYQYWKREMDKNARIENNSKA